MLKNQELKFSVTRNGKIVWKHGAELTVLRTYVENQAILEPILLCRASKCKQTKEQDSEDCLWTHIFTFLCDYYQFFFLFSAKMQK